MAALAAKALDFVDRQPAHAKLGQRFFDLFEFERLDNALDPGQPHLQDLSTHWIGGHTRSGSITGWNTPPPAGDYAGRNRNDSLAQDQTQSPCQEANKNLIML
jgi:hypothetical protein